MASRKKLADAYLELRADDSKLSPDTRVKARRIGKEFGGQLNRALAALSLDPVDVKADPKTALAAIDTTRQRLRVMSREAESVEMRVRVERAAAQLERFRKQIGEVGEEPVKVQADVSPARRQVDQLTRQLTALGLEPVNIDADPKTALAEIERVEEQLDKLSRDAATVHLRVDAESARSAVTKLRQQIGDAGEDSARSFGARFAARLGPVIAEGPGLAIAGTAIGLALAPAVASTLAAGVVGGAAGGGIIGGVILASRDQRVKAAGAALGAFILGDLERRAVGFVGPVLDGIDDIRAGWASLGPDLDRIFSSSRFVDPLVAGAVSGARRLIGGVADAVDEAEPTVAAFGGLLDGVGDAAGDAFTTLSHDADEGASSVEDLTTAISNLIRTTAGIVHAGATIKGYADQIDIAIDRGRFWVEDNSYLAKTLERLGVQLDLTADGFAAGSKEAEAARKAALGTADAMDFATLKAAGLTDAQIAAADASGTYRARTDEVNAALGRSGDSAVATEEDIARLQARLDESAMKFKLFGDIGTAAMDGLLLSSGALTGAMIEQKNQAELLRRAHEAMFGAAIQQTEANEGYEASWDELSATVKDNADQIGNNKNSLDIHTKAGRSNRDALQALLIKSGEMYYADIAAGVAIEEARKKHEKRTGAIRVEAGQLKLNKSETEKLITTYGRIPPKKTTDILIEGFGDVVKMLLDLYAYQRSLATGRTINASRAEINASLRGGYAGDPRKFKREGGEITGTGLKGVDSEVIVAAKGEFIEPVPAVDYYGVAAMQAIRRREIPREALQRYATGGLIDHLKGRNWGSRMPFEVDVRGTRIPSREQVANAVIPEFGSWPSGPGAQRGDSGVWRRIMALVRGSGIPYTFGNAYRPGDPLWHGSGRAVDFMGYNQDRLARFFMSMQSRVLELIHRTNHGDYAVTRGRRTTMPTQLPLHRNHLHVAMDRGGFIMPGWNPPVYNGTGRPEAVTTAASMDAVVARLDRIAEAIEQRLIAAVERIAPGVGREINGAASGALTIARAR